LERLGFYVADCSRSNYSPQGSITATLNQNYLSNLQQEMNHLRVAMDDIRVLLKDRVVRRELEAIGYRTVSCGTGTGWSRLTDADIYLGLDRDIFVSQRIDPVEVTLAKNTAVLILTDPQYKLMTTAFN
jgi:hypothetical protein